MQKSIKILLLLLGTLFLAAILALAAIPAYLSTESGSALLLGEANKRIEGRVAVKSLELSWTSRQEIEQLQLEDPSGLTIVTVEKITVDEPLWKLLIVGWTPTFLQLTDLNCTIEYYTDGITNLEAALQPRAASKQAREKSKQPPLIAKHVNGTIRLLDGGKKVETAFSGETEQGELDGNFHLNGSLVNGGQKSPQEEKTLDIEVNIENFPTAFIDQFFAIRYPNFKGVIPTAFGRSIDLQIREKQNWLTGETHWRIECPLLTLNIEGEIGQEEFTLTKPATAEITVTNDLFALLFNRGLLKQPVELKRASTLKLQLQEVKLPFAAIPDEKFLTDLSLHLLFEMEDFEVVGDTFSKNLHIEKIHGALLAPGDSKETTLQIAGKAGDGVEKPFNIKVDAKFDKPRSFHHFIDHFKENSELEIEANGIPSFLFDSLYQVPYSLRDLLGEKVKLSLNGKFTKREGFFSLHLDSDNIKLSNATFFVNDEVRLLEPAILHYTLHPQLIEKIAKRPLPFALRKASNFQLKLDEFHFTLEGRDERALRLFGVRGELKGVEGVDFETAAGAVVQFNDASLQLKSNSLDAIQLLLSTALITKDSGKRSISPLGSSTKIQVSANIALDEKLTPRIESADAQIQGDALHLEVNGSMKEGVFEISSPASMRYTVTPDIIRILFPHLNAVRHLEGEIPLLITIAPQKNTMRFKSIDTAALSGHISIPLLPLKFEEEKISLRDLMIPWEINGEEKKIRIGVSGSSFLPLSGKKGSFKAKLLLREWEDGHLETAYCKSSIDLINFPSELLSLFCNPQMFSGVGETLQTELRAEGSPFYRKGKCDLSINSENFSLKSSLLFDKKSHTTNPLAIKANIFPNHTAITINGEASQLFNDEGSLQWEPLKASLSIDAADINSKDVVKLFPFLDKEYNKFNAIIGSPFSCQISAEIDHSNGSLAGDCRGSKGSAALDGKLEEGNLHLNSPLIVKMKASPELGKLLFRESAPFLTKLERSDQPILLTVAPEEFSLPLKNYSTDAIEIGSFSFDLGKLTFSNSGQLKVLLSLLDKRERENITLWTTPLYGKVVRGKVHIYRMDMLLNDHFPIAAWGDIDLRKNRVNMILGVTGTALTSAFKTKPLPKNYILQLPFKGPIGNPKLDTAKAIAKISALFAQESGAEGTVLGTFLDIASGGMNEPPPPAPTTSPLPWSTEIQDEQRK